MKQNKRVTIKGEVQVVEFNYSYDYNNKIHDSKKSIKTKYGLAEEIISIEPATWYINNQREMERMQKLLK